MTAILQGPLPLDDDDPAIAHYLGEAMNQIEGWGLDEHLGPIVLAMDRFQKLGGIRGNLFELGVHHGRFAVLMALMAGPGEEAVLLDLFERQDENIDESGRGDREIASANLQDWAPGRRVRMVQANSLEIDFRRTRGLQEGVRFAHIDGGHYYEAVLNDLEKTEAVLVPGGIVMIDDFQHGGFPDVAKACLDYLANGVTKLAPAAVGHNKLVLTTRAERDRLNGFMIRHGEATGAFGGSAEVLGEGVVNLQRSLAVLRGGLPRRRSV